jgi:hypothetical protein
VKIKIIEFSSDVFSKSNQLKDIIISPLFANTTFSINIFEAISKNDEYKIKANSPIIKIGLYNGKSLLGIGEINTSKKTQKIKISTDDKNKNEDYMFFNGGMHTKLQDNDYYLTLECTVVNPKIEPIKNTKELNQKNKRKKSAEPPEKKVKRNSDYRERMGTHNPNNSMKDYQTSYKYNLNYNSNHKYTEDVISKNNNSKDYLTKNDLKAAFDENEDSFKIQSNSTIIKNDKDKMIKNILLSDNNSNSKNRNKIKNKNSNINTNEKEPKEPDINIFNLSFKKELFSDGVLILSKNEDQQNKNTINNDKNKEKEKDKYKDKYYNYNNYNKSMDIKDINNDFESSIKDFDLKCNNLSNNIYSSMNIKDKAKYFMDKTSEIFHLYNRLSNDMNKQNNNIKRYIKNYNHKIKILLKKDMNLKIKMQNNGVDELFKQNSLQNDQKYYNTEIKNINNKLSIFNDLVTYKKDNSKIKLKEIFENIITNENNRKYLNEHKNFISSILNNANINEDNEEYEIDGGEVEYKEDLGDKKDKNNKIDLEILKNKIDKLKQQYINETTTKEYQNKSDFYGNNKNKKSKGTLKQNKYSSSGGSKNIPTYKKDKNKNTYLNSLSPNEF